MDAAMVLHGLGPRAVAHGMHPLAAADFYEPGAASPPPGHVLLAEPFAATGLEADATVSLRSPALRDYVRNQLDLPGFTGYTALRLSPSEYLGCEAACDSHCHLERYRFDPATLSLTIAVRDGPSLLYKASESPGLDAVTVKKELDIIEDKIAGLEGANAMQEEAALQEIEEELVKEAVTEELDVIDEDSDKLELKDSAGTQEKEEKLDKLTLGLTEEEDKVAKGEEGALDLYDKLV